MDQFIRIANAIPDVDVAKRLLRNVTICTMRLATDGWIIIPSGIDLSNYLKNPVIKTRHGMAEENQSPVIARALELGVTATELVARELQFADTPLGREYAYLCGVNPEREVYLRAWSISGDIIERSRLTFSQARAMLGNLWDEDMAKIVAAQAKSTPILVANRFGMTEFSSVPNGADRGALTRASEAGIRTAGEIVMRMDVGAALAEIASLKRDLSSRDERITKLERDVQALSGQEASAAARRDSEALLAEIRDLARLAGLKP